ncbi:uncharacterized protein LOC124374167 [Homalodisca vitripennis]|uniref:uncharacterized protein LOC124374167 n=1 Tax=Homalodisca vitripennis TaxID=197043 RepID=UPI001EEBAD4A|nr:uncharacterized protein LOC124374167 [Homalodisca vitripennis]
MKKAHLGIRLTTSQQHPKVQMPTIFGGGLIAPGMITRANLLWRSELWRYELLVLIELWSAVRPGYDYMFGLLASHDPRFVSSAKFFLSTKAEAETVDNDERSVNRDTEKPKGEGEKLEFQAETRMLLDIVAKSLYSEKEVFIRELIARMRAMRWRSSGTSVCPRVLV